MMIVTSFQHFLFLPGTFIVHDGTIFFYLFLCLCSNMFLQVVKNALSMSEKEMSKQNNVEKFEIREQNKNKTEAKWKYKVRICCFNRTTSQPFKSP